MAHQSYQTVAFGFSRANLLTVGYRLYDAEGTAVGDRITEGVLDLGGGQYGANVAFPSGFNGRITWDTGGVNPLLASVGITEDELDDDEETDQLTEQLDEIEEKIDRLTPTLGGGYEAGGVLDPSVVRAVVPSVFDCPVLSRMRAFVVDQGVEATLEHTIRNRSGNPVDLTPLFGGDDESISTSESTGSVILRVKESLGKGSNDAGNPIWELEGSCIVPGTGTVRATLIPAIVARSGIYQLSWGIKDLAGKIVIINSSLLSVERSLFGEIGEVAKDRGPLTVQSLRLYLRDSHPNDNMRLDHVEFGDEEIIAAILRPVEFFNEQPPPIRGFTTRTFPSRYNWAQAAISVLYETAAAWYRRNKQKIVAGGMQDDDLNRDQEYEAKARQLWEEYKTWVINYKVMLNAKLVSGHVGSIYGNNRW